jgi:hypothetical protein
MRRRPTSERVAFLAATLLSALFVAGCGDEDQAKSGDAFGEGDSELVVTLDPDGADGEAEPMNAEVNCEDSSEDAACQAVRDLEPSDLAPPPTDQPCTELFGGPDVATIEGQLNGEDVNEELTRSNGCEIERFDAAVPLLQALFEGYEPGASLESPASGET